MALLVGGRGTACGPGAHMYPVVHPPCVEVFIVLTHWCIALQSVVWC